LKKWVKYKGILSSEGEYDYEDGSKEKKIADEFEKAIKFFDSVPIIYGTEHPSSFTLEDVIGKVNNFEVKDGKWYGDFNFNLEKTPKELIESFTRGDDIPASLSEFVEVDENIQKNIVPIHILVHPKLNPRVKGAGIQLRLNSIPNKKEERKMSENLEKQIRNDAISYLKEFIPKEEVEGLDTEQLYVLQKIVKRIKNTTKKEDTAEKIDLPKTEAQKIDFWAKYYEVMN